MVVIRLRRAGSKKRPFFRVVVTDARAARDSSFVEILGHYNPRSKPALVRVDKERVATLARERRAAVRFGAHADQTASHASARTRRSVRCGIRGERVSDGTGVRAVVELLAKVLTDQPDAVRVTESQHRHKTLIELFVSPADLGKVIGRQGRTAAALRTLAATAGEREGKDVTLEIRESRL